MIAAHRSGGRADEQPEMGLVPFFSWPARSPLTEPPITPANRRPGHRPSNMTLFPDTPSGIIVSAVSMNGDGAGAKAESVLNLDRRDRGRSGAWE